MVKKCWLRLLNQFRQAEAKYGQHVFVIWAFEENAYRKTPSDAQPPAIPLAAFVRSRRVFHFVSRGACGLSKVSFVPLAKAFRNLAARAGVRLLPSQRDIATKDESDRPADPVAWWLAYLWASSPPTKKDIRAAVSLSKPFIFLVQPFFDSIVTIEKLAGLTETESTKTTRTECAGRSVGNVEPVSNESDQSAVQKDHVTLKQMAAIVHRSKRTLEKDKSLFPPPAVRGNRGQPHLWDWKEVRPILEEEYRIKLPLRFPANSMRW